MIERPDWSFYNPYEHDAEICDDCGGEMIDVEDEDGKRLHCEACFEALG